MKVSAWSEPDTFEVLTWLDERTLLLQLTSKGHTTEYLNVILPRMRELLGDRRAVGIVVDLRGSNLPDAAGRAVLRDHINRITPQVRGMAIVFDDSPGAAVMRLISQFLVGHLTDLNLTSHRSLESAIEWIDGTGDAA